MEAAMEDASVTTLKRPRIEHAMNDKATKCNTPEAAVIEATAREQESELASPRGVLRELALAQWRGSATQGPQPEGQW